MVGGSWGLQYRGIRNERDRGGRLAWLKVGKGEWRIGNERRERELEGEREREREQTKDGGTRHEKQGMRSAEEREESNVSLAVTLPRRRRLLPDLFTLAAADTFLDFQNNAAIKQRERVKSAWQANDIYLLRCKYQKAESAIRPFEMRVACRVPRATRK